MDVTPRRIEVEIEEVVLHGFRSLDRGAVDAAIRAELARLIAGHGFDSPARDLQIAARDGGLVRLTSNQDAHALGVGVARATHHALGVTTVR